MTEQDKNWKAKTLLMGAAVGMAAGLASAYMRVRNAEEKNVTLKVSPKSSVKMIPVIFEIVKKVI